MFVSIEFLQHIHVIIIDTTYMYLHTLYKQDHSTWLQLFHLELEYKINGIKI